MHPAYFETRFRHSGDHVVWPQSFAIITAYATTGECWTDAENQTADIKLRRELDEIHTWMHRITGYSPSTGHAEPGWAVEMSFDMVCDTGLRYHQDAIFVVDRDQLFVSFCDERRRKIAVDRFTTRLDCRPDTHFT
jgi:hypothetical protein